MYEVRSSLLGSCLALKWYMRITEIDSLKRSLVQSAWHTSSCFHVIINFTCRPCLKAHPYALDASGMERSCWTWVPLGHMWVLLVAPTCIYLYLKPQAGKFPSLVQPVSLGLDHKLYFFHFTVRKISSSMIIKSVDQIVPFVTYVQILLKSARLKGMKLWAECIPTFFSCWIFITWHLSDSSGLHNKGRVAQFG